MKCEDLLKDSRFKLINEGDNIHSEIKGIFCCDLLSIAMSRATAGYAWVTVMANINTLAVASLTEVSCVVIAEGIDIEQDVVEKAKDKGITVLWTELPIYEGALAIKAPSA